MTNTKTTKRALLASVLSMLLCLSMLVGSTFAWFTDTATTAVNSIQSGKLDVDLVDGNGDSLDGKELSFKNVNGSADILWEPGCTYKLEEVFVENKGDLALKYQIVITGITGDAKLNEAIEWTMTIDGEAVDFAGQYTLLAGEKAGPIQISGHMKEDAGNQYQGLTIDGIAITVNATQLNHEADSFGPDYDKYADKKIVAVANQEELNAAVAAATEPTMITLADGTYTIPAYSNKDIAFVGSSAAIIDMSTAVALHNSAIALDGVTVKFLDNATYTGFQHTAKVVYDNCTINGTQFLYAPVVEFNNCTLENLTNAYCVWTYGAKDVTFTGCTFNTAGKAILVYTEGEIHADITVEDCVFNDNDSVDLKKAAVEVGSSPYSADTTYNITVSNSTVIGFAVNDEGTNTGTTVYGNKNSMDAAHLTVVIDGVTAVEDAADIIKIGTAEELFAFANDVNANKQTYAGKLVQLTADIDLENKAWTPIGQTGATQFLGTFDGCGYTISNLSIDSSAQTGGTYSSGLFGWIERHGNDANYLMAVKNVNVDGATVKGNHNVAVIAGYLIGTIQNCNVTNATVVCTHANDDACGDKAGVIAGIAAEANALIKNCTASASTVTAGRDAGQIVGACIVGKVEGCSATNVTVTAGGNCNGNNVNNALIGRTN